jgi:hypothetical protein
MSPAKPTLELALTAIGEIFAAYLGFQVLQATGPATALLVWVSAAWLAYKVTSLERLWHTFGMLLDPMKAVILATAAAFVYFGFQGFALPKLLLTGFAFTLIGASISLVAEGYWNIA